MKANMKKFFSILLALCMVLQLVPVHAHAEEAAGQSDCTCSRLCAADNVNESCEVCAVDNSACTGTDAAVHDTGAVAKVGDVEYDDFSAALENWTDGTTLTLLQDAVVDSTIQILEKTVTLDLNGWNLSLSHQNSDEILMVGAIGFPSGMLIINDSSSGKTGSVIGNQRQSPVVNHGELVINGGTFSGNYVINDGTMTVNSGKITVHASSYQPALQNLGELTITGGEIVGVNNSAVTHSGTALTITGGTLTGGPSPTSWQQLAALYLSRCELDPDALSGGTLAGDFGIQLSPGSAGSVSATLGAISFDTEIADILLLAENRATIEIALGPGAQDRYTLWGKMNGFGPKIFFADDDIADRFQVVQEGYLIDTEGGRTYIGLCSHPEVGSDGNCTDCGLEVTYELYVKGIQVRGSILSDILGDGGSVSFDPAANTLILKDANITVSEQYAIDNAMGKGMTIRLEGENTLIAAWEDVDYGYVPIRSANSGDTLIFTGPGSLYVSSNSSYDAAIAVTGNMTVEEGATLVATSASSENHNAISVCSGTLVNNGTILLEKEEDLLYLRDAQNNPTNGQCGPNATSPIRDTICLICGESCDHRNSAHTTGEDNADGTHSFTCTICGLTGEEAHEFTAADLTCICGAQAVVQVGEDFCTSLEDAKTLWDAGETLTLLADVTIPNALYIWEADQVLDLNGKTLTGTSDVTVFVIDEASVTIQDSSEASTGKIAAANYAVYNDGIAVLNGGTLMGKVINYETMTMNGGSIFMTQEYQNVDNRGTLTINGGSVYSKLSYAIDNSANLVINGGTFTSDSPDLSTIRTTSDTDYSGSVAISGCTINGLYGIDVGAFDATIATLTLGDVELNCTEDLNLYVVRDGQIHVELTQEPEKAYTVYADVEDGNLLFGYSSDTVAASLNHYESVADGVLLALNEEGVVYAYACPHSQIGEDYICQDCGIVPVYELYIFDEQVTLKNCGDILGDGTFSFDPATVTLTMNNTTLDGVGNAIESRLPELTVCLVGENAIVAACSQLEDGAGPAGVGIDCKNLTLTGDGSLTITTSGETNYGIYTYGLRVMDGVTLVIDTELMWYYPPETWEEVQMNVAVEAQRFLENNGTIRLADPDQVILMWNYEEEAAFWGTCGLHATSPHRIDGDGNYVCLICNEICDHTGSIHTTGTPAKEGHTYSCSVCGAPNLAEQHSGGTDTCMSGAACEICAEVYGQKNPANHTGNNHTENAAEATCSNPGYTGDTVCECGATIEEGEPIPATGEHTDAAADGDHICDVCQTPDVTAHAGGTATCMAKAVCSDCGAEYGELNPANHTGNNHTENAAEATCSNPGYTGDTVCECGATIEEGEPIPATGEHTDAATDGDHICDVCQTPDVTSHTGGTATCMAKATCSDCGAAYGELDPANHTGVNHTENAHEATCTAEGYTGDTVCECGVKVGEGTVIPVTEHDYVDGECVNCGAEDPEWVEPTEPTEPEDPSEPTEPEDPSEPTEPEDPSEPTEPENPSEPTEPEDPSEPTEPEDPSEPTEPEDPSEPTEPEDPSEPTEPEDPSEPTEPEDPTDPTEPEDPTEPSEPEEPSLGGMFRLAGPNRYDTGFAIANKLKEILGVDKFSAVIVAYGQNFPDALTGSYLAAVKGAPILLTEPSADANLLNYLKANLVSGGKVYILGGTAAVSQKFEDDARDAGFDVKRLKGAGRYETNLEILKEAGVNTTDEVLIATGKNYADSLSASATGLPMLLVDKNLTDSQKAFLQNTSKKFVILGGTGAVSAEVEAELDAIGDVTRVKGASRYGTSVEIAKRYFNAPSAAVLAYAQGFPDGLCGGPLAFAVGAPLILTSNESSNLADEYVVGISNGAVTGGTARISDDTVREIFDLPANTPIVKP